MEWNGVRPFYEFRYGTNGAKLSAYKCLPAQHGYDS